MPGPENHRRARTRAWGKPAVAIATVLIAALPLGRAAATEKIPASWGAVSAPTSGPARVIGGPANGCISGAARLPPDGLGYEAIRLSRHRNFGHPATIAFVEHLGEAAQAAGLPIFYVGDMAQPRGGPMAYGHGAHENGLDVDIWFNLEPKQLLPVSMREDVALPSMVLPDASAIDTHRFGRPQGTLLRLAASDKRVDRIFVHPTIKRALCAGYGGSGRGDRSWLHKIRPWYGHDDHFHVRLACPPDSPGCVGQRPVPPGDGCDASLEWWLKPHRAPVTPIIARPPKPRHILPAACRAVLDAP